MCGINGIIFKHETHPNARSWVLTMNVAISHRGPDGSDTWEGDGAVLGHQRLSINDLSDRGKQPILNTDGSLVLVCNGEIFNYQKLRAELERDGYNFNSYSDSEIILPLYQKYGEHCLDYITGMFAFAIWDRQLRKLVLARDRIGEKPLYFYEDENCFVFSSEITGILALPFVTKTFNEMAIPFLLTHKSLPAPVTMYKNIHMLTPATCLIFEEKKMRQERYWNMDFSRRNSKKKDYLEGYEAVIKESVQGCMMSDVPVGVMLSGGVDSATIALTASEVDGGIQAFCLDSGDNCGSNVEVERARYAAELMNLKLFETRYQAPDFHHLKAIIDQYGQPIWALEILFADIFAKEIRSKVKVVLTGNGADEVFGGYSGYSHLPIRQCFGYLAPYVPLIANRVFGSKANDVLRLLVASRQPVWAARGEVKTFLARQLMQKLCTSEFNARWGSFEVGKITKEITQISNPQSLLDASRCADLMVDHQHGHSSIPDISGMRHGLEIRSPFLSHKVIEFATQLPSSQILPFPYRARDTKHIMKKYLASKLPAQFVYKPKLGYGYGVPWNEHLVGKHSSFVREKLLNGRYLELGVFSKEGVAWALRENKLAVMMLLSFSCWVETELFGENHAQTKNSYLEIPAV